jgi:hypothetical protein
VGVERFKKKVTMNFKFNAEHTFFTSDTHFNLANIIGFCNRPFKDMEQMNETLIANWNNTNNLENEDNENTIMSGGAFDYKQHFIEYIADEIEQRIMKSGREIPQEVLSRNPWLGYWEDDFDAPRFYPKYNRKTMDIMKRAVYVLRLAHIYAQRVDWMLSGDDGEDSLVERLEEELKELKTKYPSGKFTFKKKRVRYDDNYGGFREMPDGLATNKTKEDE